MAVTPKAVYNTSLKIGTSAADHVVPGVTNLKVTDKFNLVDITSQGDQFTRRFPTIEDWNLNAELILGMMDNGGVAYTNDPASGSDVELQVASTAGFVVGETVDVSSSAGIEEATITVVHTDSHITVNTLGLNHTVVTPKIYRNPAQTIAHTAWRAGTVVYVKVNMDQTGTHYYSGTGYVESMDKTFDPSGIVKATLVIQPASVLTYA